MGGEGGGGIQHKLESNFKQQFKVESYIIRNIVLSPCERVLASCNGPFEYLIPPLEFLELCVQFVSVVAFTSIIWFFNATTLEAPL